MKRAILFALLTLGFNVSVVHAEDCERSISEFGTDVSSEALSIECVDWVKSHGRANARRLAPDSSYTSYAAAGALLYQSNIGETFLTAGPNTLLGEITAVAYAMSVRRIYALSSDSGRVTYYDLAIAGNVAPKGVLEYSELSGALDISVSADGDKVYVLASDRSVFVLDGKRNTTGRKEVQEMRVLARYELPEGFGAQSLAISEAEGVLYLLDSAGRTQRINVNQTL